MRGRGERAPARRVGFTIPMRGNEREVADLGTKIYWFTIPMRGNEGRMARRLTGSVKVYNPHEG